MLLFMLSSVLFIFNSCVSYEDNLEICKIFILNICLQFNKKVDQLVHQSPH